MGLKGHEASKVCHAPGWLYIPNSPERRHNPRWSPWSSSAPSPSLVTNAPRLRLERAAVAVVQFQASALASECSRAPSVVHHEAYREPSLRRMTDRSV